MVEEIREFTNETVFDFECPMCDHNQECTFAEAMRHFDNDHNWWQKTKWSIKVNLRKWGRK